MFMIKLGVSMTRLEGEDGRSTSNRSFDVRMCSPHRVAMAGSKWVESPEAAGLVWVSPFFLSSCLAPVPKNLMWVIF